MKGKPKKLYPKPVSIRFTDAERVELESKAGDLTLSAYVPSRCVGNTAPCTPHTRQTSSKRLRSPLTCVGRSNLLSDNAENDISEIYDYTETAHGAG